MPPADPRVQALVEALGLAPHPEGGHFREVFRAPAAVRPADGRDDRSAMTTIYYLLARGDHSRWHRVASDEIWHFYEGDALELFRAPPDLARVERVRLGPAGAGVRPVEVVPAGWWQASRSTGAFTLSGCTVGPGFEFADFAFLRDDPDAVRALTRSAPELAPLA